MSSLQFLMNKKLKNILATLFLSFVYLSILVTHHIEHSLELAEHGVESCYECKALAFVGALVIAPKKVAFLIDRGFSYFINSIQNVICFVKKIIFTISSPRAPPVTF